MKFGGMFNTRRFNDAGLIIKSGASEAEVTIAAVGDGFKTALNGADAEVSITSAGSGVKKVFGGSTQTVTVAAEGAGVKAAFGASETAVTVGVESGGEAYFVMPPEITIEQVGSKIRLSW